MLLRGRRRIKGGHCKHATSRCHLQVVTSRKTYKIFILFRYMKKHQFEEGDLHVSPDFAEDFSINSLAEARDYFNYSLALILMDKPKYGEFIYLYGKSNGLERDAMLAAHGEDEDEWVYDDGNRIGKIQSWINKNDGKYRSLILNSCNPEHHTPYSEKSILLIPDKISSEEGVYERDVIYSLIAPQIGEVNHTIDYEIDQLRKSMGCKLK